MGGYGGVCLSRSTSLTRVLRLGPRTNGEKEGLTGTLQVVDLRTNPQFVALSYVWGDPNRRDHFVRCNGFEVSITSNCRDALESLSDLYGHLNIWVDAICINQEDEEEKISQMKLMTEIYARAQTAYVWLGPGDARSDRAIRCLKLAAGFRVYLPGVPWASDRMASIGRDKLLMTISLTYLYIQSLVPYLQWLKAYRIRRLFQLEDLDQLLNREWIYRAWTYQEIVFSSNPIIVCGTKSISWSCLQKGLDYLNNPISPFEVSLTELLRASFSYEGPTTTAREPRNNEISRMCRSNQFFHSWRNMHLIWISASRSTKWNGQKLRSFPADIEAQDSKCSVRGYQDQFIQVRLTWHYSKLLLAFYTIVIVPGGLSLAALYLFDHALSLPDCPPPDLCNQSRHLNNISYILLILGIAIFLLGLLITVYAVRVTPYAWGNSDYNDSHLFTGLIQALRERRATEAADKAFALHGVLGSMNISSTRPEFRRPVGKVYHRLFLDLLRRKTSLINLLIDVGPEPLPGVPSWVPDWSAIHEKSWIGSEYIYNHTDLYGADFPEPHMKISEDRLGLWAVQKGTICHSFRGLAIGTTSPQSSGLGEGLEGVIGSFAQWISCAGPAAPTQIDTIYKALMGNNFTTPTPKDREILKRWIYLSKALPATSTSFTAALGNDKKLLDFMMNCSYRLAGQRVLFATTQGHIGSGPASMAVGDRLMLLKGVAVPMVLRPVKEGYNEFRVVGPAFVPGLMDLSVFNGACFGDDWEAVYLV